MQLGQAVSACYSRRSALTHTSPTLCHGVSRAQRRHVSMQNRTRGGAAQTSSGVTTAPACIRRREPPGCSAAGGGAGTCRPVSDPSPSQMSVREQRHSSSACRPGGPPRKPDNHYEKTVMKPDLLIYGQAWMSIEDRGTKHMLCCTVTNPSQSAYWQSAERSTCRSSAQTVRSMSLMHRHTVTSAQLLCIKS